MSSPGVRRNPSEVVAMSDVVLSVFIMDVILPYIIHKYKLPKQAGCLHFVRSSLTCLSRTSHAAHARFSLQFRAPSGHDTHSAHQVGFFPKANSPPLKIDSFPRTPQSTNTGDSRPGLCEWRAPPGSLCLASTHAPAPSGVVAWRARLRIAQRPRRLLG